MKVTIITSAVVLDGEKILLVKNKNKDHWYPPGGKLERGETIKEGAIREVKEETGIDIRIEKLLYAREYGISADEKIVKFVWLATSTANIRGDGSLQGDHQHDEELEEMKWFSEESVQDVHVEEQFKKYVWELIKNKNIIPDAFISGEEHRGHHLHS